MLKLLQSAGALFKALGRVITRMTPEGRALAAEGRAIQSESVSALARAARSSSVDDALVAGERTRLGVADDLVARGEGMRQINPWAAGGLSLAFMASTPFIDWTPDFFDRGQSGTSGQGSTLVEMMRGWERTLSDLSPEHAQQILERQAAGTLPRWLLPVATEIEQARAAAAAQGADALQRRGEEYRRGAALAPLAENAENGDVATATSSAYSARELQDRIGRLRALGYNEQAYPGLEGKINAAWDSAVRDDVANTTVELDTLGTQLEQRNVPEAVINVLTRQQ